MSNKKTNEERRKEFFRSSSLNTTMDQFNKTTTDAQKTTSTGYVSPFQHRDRGRYLSGAGNTSKIKSAFEPGSSLSTSPKTSNLSATTSQFKVPTSHPKTAPRSTAPSVPRKLSVPEPFHRGGQNRSFNQFTTESFPRGSTTRSSTNSPWGGASLVKSKINNFETQNSGVIGKTPVVQPKAQIPVKPVQIVSPSDEEEYKMSGTRKLAIIFNHTKYTQDLPERRGTDKDVQKLKILLRKLRFNDTNINEYHDFTYDMIVRKLDQFSKENTSLYDCLLVVVLTHGEENNQVWARDRQYPITDLYEPFTADKCPGLKGKPKIFIFQACRGNERGKGSIMPAQKIATDSQKIYNTRIPNHADFLFAYSTVPGYVSYRDMTEGTWYIQTLCEEIEKELMKPAGSRKHLVDLLTRITRKVCIQREVAVTNEKQCPSFTSMLTKDIYFRS